MKSVTTFATAFVALLLVTASCKKDSTDVDPNPSSTPAFVGATLRMTAVIMDPPQDIDGDGKPDTDVYPFLRPCDKDNTIRFEKNGQMSGDQGQIRCTDDVDPAKPATWTYDSATHVLRIVNGSDPSNISNWTVLEASSTMLKAKVSVDGGGQALSTIMTWKAGS